MVRREGHAEVVHPIASTLPQAEVHAMNNGTTIYLDNASTTWPKAPGVAEAMARFISEGAATPGRGSYTMASRNAELVSRARLKLARLIGASSPDRVILTPGATDSFNMAILGLFRDHSPDAHPPGRRPKVITTVLEHNAIRRPLHYLQCRGIIDVHEVRCDGAGRVCEEEMLSAVDDRTVLIATMSASNVVGTIGPASAVFQAVRRTRPDIVTLLDASQTAGLVPIDVEADAIDLLAFPGHKSLMGPTGTGVLYVSNRVTGDEAGAGLRLLPTRFGGTGGDSGKDDMPGAMPRRFEPGSPNSVGFVGLLAALEHHEKHDPAATLAHELSLVARLIEGVSSLPGVEIVGPATSDNRVGVLSMTVANWAPTDLGALLDAQAGIAIRAGLHCAPGAHRALGTFDRGGAIRVSPGAFNTEEDVDTFVRTLGEVVSV